MAGTADGWFTRPLPTCKWAFSALAAVARCSSMLVPNAAPSTVEPNVACPPTMIPTATPCRGSPAHTRYWPGSEFWYGPSHRLARGAAFSVEPKSYRRRTHRPDRQQWRRGASLRPLVRRTKHLAIWHWLRVHGACVCFLHKWKPHPPPPKGHTAPTDPTRSHSQLRPKPTHPEHLLAQICPALDTALPTTAAAPTTSPTRGDGRAAIFHGLDSSKWRGKR